MGSKSASLSVNIVADASQARKGFKDAQDAGAAMAAALTKAADKVENALDTTTKIAKKLADQLGPGFSATKIDKIATDFQRAGLSVEDVEKNIQQLTDGVRRLETVSGTIDDDMTTGMRNLGTETDKTRGVMANFAGNVASELPGAAGAFGPLNTAVGQFAEGLAEGEIGVKSLALAAGGMMAVSFVMGKIAEHAKKVAAIKAFDKAEVDGYAESLLDADTRVQGIAKHLREAGKVNFTFDMGVVGESIVDATDLLLGLGVGVEETARLVAGGKDSIARWGDAMKTAGASVAGVNLAMAALNDQVDYVNIAEQNNITTMRFFGPEAEDMAAKSKRLADELEAAAAASWDMNAAGLALIGKGPAMVEAYDDLTKAAQEFNAAKSPETLAAAVKAADDATSSWVDAASAQDELAGKTWTAAQNTYGHIVALQGAAGEYAVGSPLRVGLDGLIRQYAALLSLQNLEANPPHAGPTSATPGDKVDTASYRRFLAGVIGNLPTFTPTLPGNANGTMNATAGWTWVGERGPELVNFAGGESVMPAGRSASSATSSTGPVNVTVNMPAGSNGDDVVRTLQRWVRQNGPVPLATTTLVTA